MNGNLSGAQRAGRYGVSTAAQNDYGVRGGLDHFNAVSEHPLSSSASTNSSFGRRTAWKTRDASHQAPISFSSNTRGTTVNFDNPMSTPRVEF